jgi:hypothetical protein
MTTSQFLVIIGTIYIAPYLNKYVAQAIGLIFLIVAACRDLGLV